MREARSHWSTPSPLMLVAMDNTMDMEITMEITMEIMLHQRMDWLCLCKNRVVKDSADVNNNSDGGVLLLRLILPLAQLQLQQHQVRDVLTRLSWLMRSCT